MPRNNDAKIGAARELRARMTPTERILWNALRNRQLHGHKFRRQHPIGPYITDFCCLESRLVVELDGSHHNDQTDYDDARTAYLQDLGFRVLRFPNHVVVNELAGVIEEIAGAVE